MLSEALEELYRVQPWPENPFTGPGRERFTAALDRMERLVAHSLVVDVLESTGGSVRLVDLCAGTGIGGVALSRVLLDKGFRVELSLVDLRREPLGLAARFAREVLGVEPSIHVADCRSVHGLGKVFDLALVYGWSMPHFNPWEAVRLLASVSASLSGRGVFAVHEFDRRLEVFLRRGYRSVVPLFTEEGRVLLQLHAGYRLETGEVERVVVSLEGGGKTRYPMFFWGLAELAALHWVFFQEVDILGIGGSQAFIVAARPRAKLSPEDFAANPLALRERAGLGRIVS